MGVNAGACGYGLGIRDTDPQQFFELFYTTKPHRHAFAGRITKKLLEDIGAEIRVLNGVRTVVKLGFAL